MSLATKHNQAYTAALESSSQWGLWFQEDLPPDVEADVDAKIAASMSAGYSTDILIEMLESGQTNWFSPGWVSDLYEIFEDWCNSGKLIRARLTAQWLLSTMPDDPLDSDVLDTLSACAAGDFCSAFYGSSSFWPHTPEFYLCNLDWPMFESASDSEMDYKATGQVWMIQKWGKVA